MHLVWGRSSNLCVKHIQDALKVHHAGPLGATGVGAMCVHESSRYTLVNTSGQPLAPWIQPLAPWSHIFVLSATFEMLAKKPEAPGDSTELCLSECGGSEQIMGSPAREGRRVVVVGVRRPPPQFRYVPSIFDIK